MDRRSPGGLDFLATPPPGVAQPVVAQGRVVHFDWPGTLDDPQTSTTPPQFSGISLLDADARGAFAFVARPPKRRGKRGRRPSDDRRSMTQGGRTRRADHSGCDRGHTRRVAPLGEGA